MEVILPGAVFCGEISCEQPQDKSQIKEEVQLDALMESIKIFYKKEYEREYKQLKTSGVIANESIFTSGGLPLRLGRHSGAESVTIEGYRKIKIIGRDNERRWGNTSTTIWLTSEESKPKFISGCKPFGWADLNELTPKVREDFNSLEQSWKGIVKHKVIQNEARIKEQKEAERKAAEETRKKAEEEEARRKAEEKRKDELKAMSPEERDIEELSSPSITEQTVIEIFMRLNTFSAENKIKAAKKIKNYWIKHNKWEKKDCSEKQLKKVQEVKKILGEIV
jgi:hypothetical protein